MMKHISIVLITCMALLFSCKKYEEGGRVNKTVGNLFGGKKDLSDKTWKLALYESDGIDSTHLIYRNGAIPDFYEKYIRFGITHAKPPDYHAFYFSYNDGANVKLNSAAQKISFSARKSNANICFTTSQNICTRNILVPEGGTATEWYITKLTEKELILTTSLNHNYKIIFTQ